jgi:hypothetical protein
MRHTVVMDQRALLLETAHRNTPEAPSERTIERLLGLSVAFPEFERHDAGLVADALSITADVV